MRRARWQTFAVLWMLLGCDGPATPDAGTSPDGGTDAGTDAGRDVPLVEPPDSVSIGDGVVRERLRIEGAAPAANPTSGAETPAALNATIVLRYRAEPAEDVRAVLVVLPGFLAGAGSLEPLAVALVRSSVAAGGPVEVWAIDRRANLLEDARGMLAAEAAGDPEIARGYYLGNTTVGGEPFAGHLTHEDASFASEWGLATQLEDVRRVIARVPEAERRGHVFLMGHSLGAWTAEAYAAWRFADGRGAEELAGVVMIDGVLLGAPVTEAEYRTDGFFGPGLDVPSLAEVRASSALVEVEGAAPDVFGRILALRARFTPDAVIEDALRDAHLARTSFALAPEQMPAMSNTAALGFLYDFDYRPNEAITVGMGRAQGPAEEYTAESPFGQVLRERPSDPAATYGWVDGPDVTDFPERVRARAFAEAWTRGGIDGVEHYFPFRALADLYAVRGNAVSESGWQASEGLRAFDGGLDDAPFLCIASTFDPGTYEPLRARLAPMVGAGRPQAGALRSSDSGFLLVRAPMLHAETTLAPDTDDNPIPEAILGFVDAHAEPVTITPP